MRILLLLTQDLESPSGLGRYWPMAQAFVEHGNQVRIAALHSNWQNLKSRKFTRDGVDIEYVAPMHIRKIGSTKYYYGQLHLLGVVIRATWALIKAALSESTDFIIVGKPHPMNSIAGVVASKLRKSTLCVDCDDFEAGSNRFTNRWQKELVKYFEMKVPLFARLVSTNTQFMMTRLLDWGCPSNRVIYLPNGIETDRFARIDQLDVEDLRINIGIVGKRVVIYVGSLSLTNHPIDLLLQAFKIVSAKMDNVVLLIVGGGEDYEVLITQAIILEISKRTYFVGRIDPVNIPKYYALADVSVDPVHNDDASKGRSPLKLFESWACGVPFVTSPVGDREYLLQKPPAGILVEPSGDPEALADGILRVLTSGKLSQELRQKGFERLPNYTWDNLALHFEQNLRNLL